MQQEKQYISNDERWNGGLAEESRFDVANSGRFLIGADIRSDAGLFSVAHKPVRHDNGVVAGEIDWIEPRPEFDEVYYYGGNKIYKEENDVTTLLHEMDQDDPNGQGLAHFDGYLYYRTATRLGRYDYNATFDDDWQVGLSSSPYWSPLQVVKNVLLVGHGRYVGTIDDVGYWTPERITLPPDYHVRSIFRSGSYAIILATYGKEIGKSEKGMAFIWDTTAKSYNDYIPLDGNPHAGISHKNRIIIFAGQKTTIQESLLGTTDIVQTLPRLADADTAEIYPGAVDIWRNLVHFGISAGTSNTVIRAVYNWGAKNIKAPHSLNPEFPTSMFDTSGDIDNDLLSSSVQITACKKIGTTLRYAFKSGSTYGVDQIDLSQYQSQAIFRSLAIDLGTPLMKTTERGLIELANKINENETVTLKLSTEPWEDEDFSSSEAASMSVSTEDEKVLEFATVVNDAPIRGRDLHYELRIAGTGSTRPVVKRVAISQMIDPDVL